MSYQDTKHGEARVTQRGFLRKDLELVRRCGTLLHDRGAEVYFLKSKDVEEGIKELKRQIQCLERMRGCKVAYATDNALITAHHTNRRSEKQLLRRVS